MTADKLWHLWQRARRDYKSRTNRNLNPWRFMTDMTPGLSEEERNQLSDNDPVWSEFWHRANKQAEAEDLETSPWRS